MATRWWRFNESSTNWLYYYSPFFVEILRFGSYIRKTENFRDCLEAEFSDFLVRFSVLRKSENFTRKRRIFATDSRLNGAFPQVNT